MINFLYGITVPFRAAWLILRSPALMVWSAIPVFITLLIYILSFAKFQNWAHVWISNLLASQGLATEGVLAGAASLMTWLILILAGAFTFSSVATVFSVPFNDYLAEQSESRTTPALPPCGPIHLRKRIKLLTIDLLKALLGSGLAFFALILSWIPGVNIFALPLTFLIVCFQFISFPQTRRGEGVTEAIAFISRNLGLCLGFGATTTGLFAIPFLSCFMLPLAVVGGTILYARVQAD